MNNRIFTGCILFLLLAVPVHGTGDKKEQSAGDQTPAITTKGNVTDDSAADFKSRAKKKAGKGDLANNQLDYKKAADFYKKAADLIEPLPDSKLTLARYLQKQGNACRDAGLYAEAEKPLKRSLEIREKHLKKDHEDVAAVLDNLADLYLLQGRYEEAEPLYKRSLAAREKSLGPEHSDIAQSLGGLAELYRKQGRNKEAEPLYKRSLAINEKNLGPDHPSVALLLNNLAGLYHAQGRYKEAGPLYKRISGLWR
ncbi:MAG: tetratricopeptide repeat protein [Desulfobacteraceae bacterium]|nr:tetratricopeptide repeat protein [Desulfobacteraceae bacterium]